MIVETMTDNRNRTAGSMRHHFDKYGGNMGATGCVSWSFDRKGVLVIDNEDGDYEEDAVMMDAMDSGADDFEAEEDCFTIYTSPDDFNAVSMPSPPRATISPPPRSRWSPRITRSWRRKRDIANMEKMLDLFDDDDDVQNVWHNWEQE